MYNAFLLIFLAFSVLADTELEVIEIEAEKDIKRFTFVNSHHISEHELETQSMGIFSPVLEKVPGLIAVQAGGPGGTISYFMRGTESRHVSFTLDGLKINDTSHVDRQFNAAFMSSPFIKEITVHKSPQAVLFGSDALGGMIEMKTRKGENAPETRLSVNGGSFGTLDSSLSSDWKKKHGNGTLTVSRFHTDGLSRLNKKRFDADERDATDITQLTSSSEHRWGNKIQTNFLASYLHSKAEQDSFAIDNSDDFSRNDQYILQQKTDYELASKQTISLRNGFNRHQRYINSLSKSEFFNGNLSQHQVIHRLELGNFGFLSGLGTEKESSKAISMDRSFDLHSVFFQSSYQLDEFKFHVGGRSDYHTKYGSFNTGSTGLSYADFSLQYSQGYKVPSLYQLYGPDSFGAPVGNRNLVPETNHSLEASWRKKTEFTESGITLFQNRLKNQFTYSFTQGYLNQQRFTTEGVEVFGSIKTTRTQLDLSFNHQQFKKEEAPVLRRPYNSAQFGFSYFSEESIELNITERWFSSRRDYGTAGILKLNSYEVTDLSVRKTWENDDIALQLKNVLNREYEDMFGFNVMPRAIFAHYGHKFQ